MAEKSEGRRREEIREGVRKARLGPFPQQHPSWVAAPGAQNGRFWIQAPERGTKVAVAYHEGVEGPEPRERDPLALTG